MLCSVCNSRPRRAKSSKCHTCESRLKRDRDRVKYAFNTLRSNAKRRGHGFDLTLEQFRNFAIETDYIVNKGKTATSYSIDRRENDKGYTLDNIQIMTLADNSRKHTKRVVYEPETRQFYTATLPIDEATTHTDCPF